MFASQSPSPVRRLGKSRVVSGLDEATADQPADETLNQQTLDVTGCAYGATALGGHPRKFYDNRDII
jgi:hypothetical protein